MLAGLNEVINEGRKRGIAVGCYNTPNIESLIAVVGAAEELNVPIIIAHAQVHEKYSRLDDIGPVMVEWAKKSRVKVCVHLDHGEDFEYCERAINMGFTSVMIDFSASSYEENIEGTRKMVEFAHAHGAEVEAELGKLPRREGEDPRPGEENEVYSEDMYTDSNLVCDYLERTGADALAIAFGAVHGMYRTKPVFNFDVITKVKEKTSVPLVMHGGSGVSDDEYREIIRRGVDKINCYSYMAFEGSDAVKKALERKDPEYFHVLAHEAKLAMKENCKKTLKVFSNME